MPFEGENGSVSMLIFLPLESTANALNDLLDKLSSDTFDTLPKMMYREIVDIRFPKINMRSEFFLKDVSDLTLNDSHFIYLETTFIR